MSGQLIPAAAGNAAGGSSFQQQGQIDWAALTRSTIQTSVGALARWSRAGVDEYTVQVGKILCNDLVLPAEIQEYLVKRIRELGAIGFIDDTLWIGFGIKQVLVDLVETEQGLALITLCSALSVRYKDAYGGQVLRQLCSHAHPPDILIPSYAKWKALFSLCSGILAASSFELLMTGIYRLLKPDRNPIIHQVEQPSISPYSLAASILKLSSFSKHRILRLDITGTHDLCWLAAFAEWTLALDVAIFSADGTLVYRSRKQNPEDAQVVFHVTLDSEASQSLTTRSMSVIDDAQDLIRPIKGTHETQLKLSSSWSTILRETFGDILDTFIPNGDGKHLESHANFAFILNHMYHGDHQLRRGQVSWPFSFNLQHTEDSYDMSVAQRLLPEFKFLRHSDGARVGCDVAASLQQSLESFDLLCGHKIRKGSKYREACSRTASKFCIVHVLRTLCQYVHVLRFVDIGKDVLPSVYGLKRLYADDAHERLTFGIVKYLLTGDNSSNPINRIGKIAEAANGVCISLEAMANPMVSIGRFSRLRVTLGGIYHRDARYDSIMDAQGSERSLSTSSSQQAWAFSKSSELAAKTLIIESEDERMLLLGHRIHVRSHPAPQHHFWVSLGRMYAHFASSGSHEYRSSSHSPTAYHYLPRKNFGSRGYLKAVQKHFSAERRPDDYVLSCAPFDFNSDRDDAKILDLIFLPGEPAALWTIYQNMESGDLQMTEQDLFGERDTATDWKILKSSGFEKLLQNHSCQSRSGRLRAQFVGRMPSCFACLLEKSTEFYRHQRIVAFEYMICLDQQNRLGPMRLLLKRWRPAKSLD